MKDWIVVLKDGDVLHVIHSQRPRKPDFATYVTYKERAYILDYVNHAKSRVWYRTASKTPKFLTYKN